MVSRTAQWKRLVPSETNLVPVIPSTDYLRRQFEYSKISSSQGRRTGKQRPFDCDRLMELVADAIEEKYPSRAALKIKGQIELVTDECEDNDFMVGPESLFVHPSQLGIMAGQGAYASQDIKASIEQPTALYGSGFYFMSLAAIEKGAQYEDDPAQQHLETERLTVEHSDCRYMFPEVQHDGINYRLGIDANPENPYTRACVAAYQAAAISQGKVVTAGCGARVNHAMDDPDACGLVTSNTQGGWFTVHTASGRRYPCAGKFFLSPDCSIVRCGVCGALTLNSSIPSPVYHTHYAPRDRYTRLWRGVDGGCCGRTIPGAVVKSRRGRSP